MTIKYLVTDVGAVSTGPWVGSGDSGETGGIRSVQVGIKGVGAVTATIRISGANDGRFPVTIVDFALSGTNSATDAVELAFPWETFRAEIIAISTGTLATAVIKV